MKYEIWVEGYRATGEHGIAQKLGEYEAETFDDAVKIFTERNPDIKVERNEMNCYNTEEAYHNRRSDYNIWRCNLFDNEIDARKIFG